MRRLSFLSGFCLLVVACASVGPMDVVSQSGRECQVKFPGVQLVDVDRFGRLMFRYYSTTDLEPFQECVHERVRERLKSEIASGRVSQAQAVAATSVPIEVVSGLILVPVTINGPDQARLLLDTGAQRSALKPGFLRRSGIEVRAKAPRWPFSMADGRIIFASFLRLRSLRVGDLVVEDLDVAVYDFLPEATAVDGLLGADFLGHFRVSVDRSSERLTLEVPLGSAVPRPATETTSTPASAAQPIEP